MRVRKHRDPPVVWTGYPVSGANNNAPQVGLCVYEGKHAKRHTVGTVRSTVHCTPRCRSLRQQRSAMAAHLPTLGEVFSFFPALRPPLAGAAVVGGAFRAFRVPWVRERPVGPLTVTVSSTACEVA